MKTLYPLSIFIFLVSFTLIQAEAKICEGFGPQTPRDITKKAGSNPVEGELAPDYDEMNLCNIHFHKHAEHKGPDFSVFKGDSDHGGYACNMEAKLTDAEKKPAKGACGELEVGDTIEVHWVHTNCSVAPGPGLSSCLSEKCANPQLRVEAEVFLLVNDRRALDFNDFDYRGKRKGYHQAKKISDDDGAAEFLGSTTGPDYNEGICSPLQVTWNVRPTCKKMDINSVHRWCEKNRFEEKRAHGVRPLVTNKKLLSEIDD